MKKIFFLILLLVVTKKIILIAQIAPQNNAFYGNGHRSSWGNNSYVNFNNPAWRYSPARRDVERRNVYNWPLEYQRYSEMGPYEQASPYAPPGFVRRSPAFDHAISGTSFNKRHNTYYRGVYFDGYTYRNVRW